MIVLIVLKQIAHGSSFLLNDPDALCGYPALFQKCLKSVFYIISSDPQNRKAIEAQPAEAVSNIDGTSPVKDIYVIPVGDQ